MLTRPCVTWSPATSPGKTSRCAARASRTCSWRWSAIAETETPNDRLSALGGSTVLTRPTLLDSGTGRAGWVLSALRRALRPAGERRPDDSGGPDGLALG